MKQFLYQPITKSSFQRAISDVFSPRMRNNHRNGKLSMAHFHRALSNTQCSSLAILLGAGAQW